MDGCLKRPGNPCRRRRLVLERAEAISKDPWRLTPPKNILNEWLFFLILLRKIKKNNHSFIILFRRRRRRIIF
jgi:hypothetical protein